MKNLHLKTVTGRPGFGSTHLDATEFQNVNLIVEVLNGAKPHRRRFCSSCLRFKRNYFPLRLQSKPSLENQTYLKNYLQQWFTGTFLKITFFPQRFYAKRYNRPTTVNRKVSAKWVNRFLFCGIDVLCYDLAVTLNDWAISTDDVTFGSFKKITLIKW